MTKGYRSTTPTKREGKYILSFQNETALDSPTSSTTTESSSLASIGEQDAEIQNNILDILYDTSDESIGVEEIEDQHETSIYVADKSSLKHFVDIPDIENISDDISVCTIELEKEIALDARSDRGHFVDPLTGFKLQTTTLIDYKADDSFIVSSDENSDSESQHAERIKTKLSKDIQDETSFNITNDIEQSKDIFETFLEINLAKIEEKRDEIDWKTTAKEQESKRVHQQTLEFINDLICRVVKQAEFISPEFMLRKNLDRRKLLMEIVQTYNKYDVERKFSELLHRKVVDFYKRRKLYRPIMQESAKTLSQDKQKYHKALKHLDDLLAKKKDLEESSQIALQRLRSELNETKQNVNDKVLFFEASVKKTLFRETSPKLNAIIEDLLKQISNYRKEISDIRYKMITKQHMEAVLLEKLSRLEDLGDDLTLNDYNRIQTENQTLGKKIEERNTELNKQLIRSRNCKHLLAHFKDKKSIVNDVVENQRKALNQLIDERSSLRKYIYELKLERSRLREAINELSIKGGLLDKPALMYDYDQMIVRVNEKRETVKRLRVTLDTIEQRIIKLENRFTKDNHKFSLIR